MFVQRPSPNPATTMKMTQLTADVVVWSIMSRPVPTEHKIVPPSMIENCVTIGSAAFGVRFPGALHNFQF